MGLSEIAKKLPARGWAMLGATAIVSIGFLFFVMQFASAPSYSTLMAGINPAQTGKISAALAAQGIPYQLQNSGTAVAVPAGDVSSARIALATANLLSPNQSDSSLFNTSSLGQSDFQQQVGYQVALEQQLQDTIDQVQGVNSSTVQLVIPNPQTQLFSQSAAPTTAAVLIAGGSTLSPSAVAGIAAMVANSVQGLTPSKVTITADNGQQLWPDGNSGGSSAASAASTQSANNGYDQTEEIALEGMLAQVLGAGKSSVVVNATLNENQSSTQQLQYIGKPVAASTHSDTESLVNKGGGTAGTATGTVTTGSAGNSNYSHRISDTQNVLGKQVTTTTVAPGTIKSQSVSVLVPAGIAATEIAALTAAVKSAIGFQAGRDVVTLKPVAFAATPKVAATPTAASPTSGIMGMAKNAIVGLGAVIFLFFISRVLRKREREGIPEPTWLRELERPRSLIELEEESGNEPVRVKRLRAAVNPAKVQVEDLVSRDPDRVAAQVREWMADD
jgi:flagellar M-ring protein FliF